MNHIKTEAALVAVRFLSAASLFIFLAKSNVWLSPITATLLVLGYRLGIFLALPVQKICQRHGAAVCFLLASLGSLLWYFDLQQVAVAPLAIGLAISGYLIKAEAAQTAKGSAWVAMAMNAGSLVSGAVLALAGETRSLLLVGGAAALAGCAIIMVSFTTGATAPKAKLQKASASLGEQVAWALLGMATGILVFSIFSVLPQTLLAKSVYHGELPSWFGWLVSTNAAVVVVFSLPIARLTGGRGLGAALLPLLGGLGTLVLPSFMPIDTFVAAFLWVVAISIFECGLSHLDHLAATAKALLVKEASFGIGASLCVLVSRLAPGEEGGLLMGVMGITLAGLGAAGLYLPLQRGIPASAGRAPGRRHT